MKYFLSASTYIKLGLKPSPRLFKELVYHSPVNVNTILELIKGKETRVLADE